MKSTAWSYFVALKTFQLCWNSAPSDNLGLQPWLKVRCCACRGCGWVGEQFKAWKHCSILRDIWDMVLHDAFSLKYLRVHHFLDPQSCFGSFFYYPNMDGIQRAPILTHEHFRANTSAQSSSNHCELFAQSDSKNVSSGTSKYLQIVAPRPLVLRGTRSHISTGDRFFFFGCNYFILYYAVYTFFLRSTPNKNIRVKRHCKHHLYTRLSMVYGNFCHLVYISAMIKRNSFCVVWSSHDLHSTSGHPRNPRNGLIDDHPPNYSYKINHYYHYY